MSTQTLQHNQNTVVNLPKKFSLRGKDKHILKQKKLSEKGVENLVEKLSGGLDLKYHPTPEEINKILDEEYDDHEIVLPGR